MCPARSSDRFLLLWKEDAQNNHWIQAATSRFQFTHYQNWPCQVPAPTTSPTVTAEQKWRMMRGSRLKATDYWRVCQSGWNIATNGCRIDSALLKDFSEVEIECIANLMQEDKSDVLFGIKSVVEKFVKCKCRVSTRCAPVIILTLTHQCATITTIL